MFRSKMTSQTTIHKLRQQIELLPGVQQQLGRFVLRHGSEVPFLSVRSLAQRANVAPATVTRLSHALGFPGYRELRAFFKAVFYQKQTSNTRTQDSAIESGQSLALQSVFSLDTQLHLKAIAAMIFNAPCHVAGFRSAYSLSHYLSYLLHMVRHDVYLVPSTETAALDHVTLAKPEHVLVIFSTFPYAAESVALAEAALKAGLIIIAVTDSQDSPLVSLAHDAIVVDQVAMQYISTRVSFFALIEFLIESGCALSDRKSRRELKQFRARIDKHAGYWTPDGASGEQEKPRS